jgi:hypothetical protein
VQPIVGVDLEFSPTAGTNTISRGKHDAEASASSLSRLSVPCTELMEQANAAVAVETAACGGTKLLGVII